MSQTMRMDFNQDLTVDFQSMTPSVSRSCAGCSALFQIKSVDWKGSGMGLFLAGDIRLFMTELQPARLVTLWELVSGF